MSLLLTLNRFQTLFWCFYCWLWASKCELIVYGNSNLALRKNLPFKINFESFWKFWKIQGRVYKAKTLLIQSCRSNFFCPRGNQGPIQDVEQDTLTICKLYLVEGKDGDQFARIFSIDEKNISLTCSKTNYKNIFTTDWEA